MLAYSPLAGGRLSGKYIGGKNPKNARYTLWPRRFSRHHTTRGEIAIEKYFKPQINTELHLLLLQMLLLIIVHLLPVILLEQPDMNQLKENIDSIDVILDKEILSDIQDIHLGDPNPCV